MVGGRTKKTNKVWAGGYLYGTENCTVLKLPRNFDTQKNTNWILEVLASKHI